jgi:hypothetical protein
MRDWDQIGDLLQVIVGCYIMDVLKYLNIEEVSKTP